jgi:hypothetical protein
MVGAEQNPTMKQFWIAISTWVIFSIIPAAAFEWQQFRQSENVEDRAARCG